MIKVAIYSREPVTTDLLWSSDIFEDADKFVDQLKLPEYDICVLNFADRLELELLSKCRSSIHAIPIIVIARLTRTQYVSCFNEGATVVLPDPLDPQILDLQVTALALVHDNPSISYYDLTWDRERDKFFRGLLEIHLSKTQKSILRTLIAQKERSLSREELIAKAWPSRRRYCSDGTVDRAISRLRAALEVRGKENPIKTTHGVGYRLEYKIDDQSRLNPPQFSGG